MPTGSPRVALVPPAHDLTFAEEAVELAASVGLVADDWQTFALRAALGLTDAGRWSSPRFGLSVARQQGKGAVLEILELSAALAGYRVIHTAHLVATSLAHFRRLRDLCEHQDVAPYVKHVAMTNGREAIEFTSGGRVAFVARSKASGRGLSADLLVCDEAQILPESVFAALLPTISASPNPLTVLTGTPPGPLDDGIVFTRFRDAGLVGEDTRLAWLEYSATDDDPVDDPATWAKANPALGIRLAEDTVRDELAAMDEATFRRERLGQWDNFAALQVIPLETWLDLIDQTDPAGRIVFGVDVSPDRSRATIAAAGRLENGAISVQIVEAREGTEWLPARLKQLLDRHSPSSVVVDTVGPAAALIPAFRNAGIGRVKIQTLTVTDVARACAGFVDAAAAGTLRHPNTQPLNDSLAIAAKRPLGDGGFAWKRKDAKGDLTPLIAATFAHYSLATRPVRDRDLQKISVVL